MEDLLKAIDSEKKNRFTKSWSKLERGTKLNRLNDFIESEKEKNELNEEQHQNLHALIIDLFDLTIRFNFSFDGGEKTLFKTNLCFLLRALARDTSAPVQGTAALFRRPKNWITARERVPVYRLLHGCTPPRPRWRSRMLRP